MQYIGNDGDVISPMMYTLMVEATNTTGNNPPQYASDGPITLTGSSLGCMYMLLVNFLYLIITFPDKVYITA